MTVPVIDHVEWVFGKMDSINIDVDTSGSERGCDLVLRATSDHAVTRDPRALHRLRAMEKTCQVPPYFGPFRTEIQPYMRRILALWMLQVCSPVKRF